MPTPTKSKAPVTIEQVREALKQPAAAAVNTLLEAQLSPGTSVCILSDPLYGMDGQRAKIKGNTADKIGYVDVEFANGNVLPQLANLLLPL